MEKPKFEFYTRPNGHTEFLEFLETIPKKDRAKLLSTIANTQALGLQVAQRQLWIKRLKDGIYELRSKVGSNIQRGLYFHQEGNKFIITHGFTKKTEKTPPSEIQHAKILMKEFEKNHQGGKEHDQR